MPTFNHCVSFAVVAAAFGLLSTLHWFLALTCPVVGAVTVAILFASEDM